MGIFDWLFGGSKNKTEGNYKDGNKEGLWKYYLENGQLEAEGNYKDGKEEGLWKYYLEDGQLEAEGNYKDGKREGLWKYYYENGQLKSEENFKDANTTNSHYDDIDKEVGREEITDETGTYTLGKDGVKNYTKITPMTRDEFEKSSQFDRMEEARINISTSELNETSLIIISTGGADILLKGKLSSLSNDVDYYLSDECHFEDLEKLNKNNLIKIDGEWSYKDKNQQIYFDYDFYGLKDDIPEMNIYLFSVSCKLGTMADEALDVLYVLKVFLPNEKFVLYKRYGTTEDSYLDVAYLSPEQPIEHTYTEIHSLPNEENFDEDAPGHYGVQMEDLAVILKYKEFKTLIKDYNGGMLNF